MPFSVLLLFPTGVLGLDSLICFKKVITPLMVNSLLLPLHPVFKGSQFSLAGFTALLGVGDVYRSIRCS